VQPLSGHSGVALKKNPGGTGFCWSRMNLHNFDQFLQKSINQMFIASLGKSFILFSKCGSSSPFFRFPSLSARLASHGTARETISQ